MKRIVLFGFLFLVGNSFAQNVGIGIATPAASAKLDVTSTNSGVLIPRLALTAANLAGPVAAPATSLLVYNTATAGAGINAVTPGYYYWNGTRWVRMATDAWLVGGNSLAATGSLGTISNNHVDLITNNVVRGRLSNLGEFFIGTTNTVLAGDLMNGVGNATFPWALNGYTTFNGAGVYGAVQGGNTIYAGVQGEYEGTNAIGAGVRGLNAAGVNGTNFLNPASGVMGDAQTVGSYKFGVYGLGGGSVRSGGVMGNDFGFAYGSLGYYASNGLDYAVYGFGQAHTNGVAGGKMMAGAGNSDNTTIGIGLGGGFMGGWIQGEVYGTLVKGERFGMYVDGKTYVNQPVVQLMEGEDARIPVYASTSMDVEVSDKGRANLVNGSCFVSFSDDFKKVMSLDLNNMIVVVTPMGNTKGVFVASINETGFQIEENNDGNSSVALNWMVTTKQKGSIEHSSEIIANDFDNKMNGLMVNDNDPAVTAQPVWWDGVNIRFDTPNINRNQYVNGQTTLRGFQPNNSNE
jgi:hypothetical protein